MVDKLFQPGSSAHPSYTSLQVLVEDFNEFFIRQIQSIRDKLQDAVNHSMQPQCWTSAKAINSYWRSRVHSLCSAFTVSHKGLSLDRTFHPVNRPSSRCNCSSRVEFFVLCRWHLNIYSYWSCKSGSFSECPLKFDRGDRAFASDFGIVFLGQ